MRVSGAAVGALALFLGALTVQGSLRSDEASSRRGAKTNPERETAELLDALVQPRFQVTNGKDFGVSRIAPRIQGHGRLGNLTPENPAEKRLLEQVTQLACDYRLGFIHTGHKLSRVSAQPVVGKIPDYEPIWRDEADYNARKDEYKAPYKERLFSLVGRSGFEGGAKLDTKLEGWQVFLRPVKAEKESCASCHAGVKQGQVMGAMVYFVKSIQASVPSIQE